MRAVDAARASEDLRRRAVVLAVRPSVDGGRYPAKRCAGDRVEIEADIVGDGHDLVRAIVLDRAPGSATWRETDLVPAGNDVYRGAFDAPAIGLHAYTVIAWIDHFATWRRGLEKKVAASVNVDVELMEGALLVEAALDRVHDPVLAAGAAALRGGSDRIAAATSPE